MTNIFRALSDETRLRILSMIWSGEMCVCEIEDCLELTQSNASRHLTALRNAGILSHSKKAQWAFYALNESFFQENADLCNYLDKKLRELPTYRSDSIKREKAKLADLCGCVRRTG